MIVTTCKLEEGGRPKCAKFWPEQGEDFAKILNVEGMHVVQTKSEEISNFNTRRTFKVTDNGKSHEVIQIHYKGWPDHGVPTNESLSSFEQMLYEYIEWLIDHSADD